MIKLGKFLLQIRHQTWHIRLIFDFSAPRLENGSSYCFKMTAHAVINKLQAHNNIQKHLRVAALTVNLRHCTEYNTMAELVYKGG